MSRTRTISWWVSDPMATTREDRSLGSVRMSSSYSSATRRGCLEQALAVGVLAYPLEEKAGGLLDLGLVDHRTAASSLRSSGRRW